MTFGEAWRWGASTQESRRIFDADAVAEEAGCTPTQVAIAWLRPQPGVLMPLIGVRTLVQREDNLGAPDVTLEEAQIRRLERASPLDLGFPHDFLVREYIRKLTHAGTFDLIDNHRSG